jgi:hypothetical protein
MNSSDNTPQEGVKGTKRSTTELSDGHAAENSFAPRTPHGQGYARSFTKRGIPKSILRAAKCIPKGIRWGYFGRGNDRMSSDERSHEPVGKPADTTGETSTHQPDVTPPTSHMERANGSAECANDAAKKHIDRELRLRDRLNPRKVDAALKRAYWQGTYDKAHAIGLEAQRMAKCGYRCPTCGRDATRAEGDTMGLWGESMAARMCCLDHNAGMKFQTDLALRRLAND